MLKVAALLALMAVEAPSQTPNPACDVLKADEVASLVGSGAKTIQVSANPHGASCMYQNGDKMVTVLVAIQTSNESASDLWTTKKRVAAGQDLSGWPIKAYEGSMGKVPMIGLAKGKTFLEVKVIDDTQKLADIAPKLRAAVKTAAARMP